MADSDQLSEREREVLNLLLQGRSNKQIAHALGIAESTVEFHLTNIYRICHVGSRAELLAQLGNPLASAQLGESTVDNVSRTTDNENTISPHRGGRSVKKYMPLLLVGVLIVGALLIAVWLKGRTPPPPPGPGLTYERECENFDAHTVGQVIARSSASGLNVYGQFGTIAASPWTAKAGDVQYNNINIQSAGNLSVKLRYSKHSLSSVPIQLYIDSEPTPKATFYPLDQGSWDRFVWTEPIGMGRVESGLHTIKFSTDGQQYGVADLDVFVLSIEAP